MEKINDTLYISYGCGDIMAMPAGISLLSLYENNQAFEDIVVYIWDGGISEANKRNLVDITEKYGRKIEFMDVSIVKKMLDGLNIKLGTWGAIVYGKYFLGKVLPKEISRIIYVDSDTLVVGSLDQLWNMDMKKYPIAMAIDMMNIGIRKQLEISNQQRYYNTGMVLYDLEQYRRQKCEDIFLNHIRNVRQNYMVSEQDISSVCLNDKITSFPMEYNYISVYDYFDYKNILKMYGLNRNIFYSEEEYNYAKENVKIIHFPATYLTKPWFSNCISKRIDEYDRYWAKTPWKVEKKENKLGKMVLMQRFLFLHFPPQMFSIFQRVGSNIVMEIWKYNMRKYIRKEK